MTGNDDSGVLSRFLSLVRPFSDEEELEEEEHQTPAEIIRRVKRLELRVRGKVTGLLQGAFHSSFKGRGIEFAEVREYVPGDDVRTIDWNVTARMNAPYVKEYTEERNIDVHLVIDVSGSFAFGSGREKGAAAREIAASLMFCAMRNNDRVGLILFTDTVVTYFPPRGGRKHVLRCVRELVANRPRDAGTDVPGALAFLAKVAKKRGIVFVISDFPEPEGLDRPLRVLGSRHDLVAVRVRDPREVELPDAGLIELEDAETGEHVLVDTSDRDVREAFSRIADEEVQGLVSVIGRANGQLVEVSTEEPFEEPLRRFFARRDRRRH